MSDSDSSADELFAMPRTESKDQGGGRLRKSTQNTPRRLGARVPPNNVISPVKRGALSLTESDDCLSPRKLKRLTLQEESLGISKLLFEAGTDEISCDMSTSSERETKQVYKSMSVEQQQSEENVVPPCSQNGVSLGADEADDGDFYGLGAIVKTELFSVFNITGGLHEWQRGVLRRHVMEDMGHKNALILAPTSGGKSLVAIILLLRSMLIEGKDAIFTLPYVAIVSEKLKELRALASKLNSFSTLEYSGTKGHLPVPRQKINLPTLYVATPEKALGIWKCLCADGERNKEIGIAVFDELHMIADGTRGAVLEELIVSLMNWSRGAISMCALSATVGNPTVLRDFLGGGHSDKCTIHQVTKRPRDINEFGVVKGSQVCIRRDHDCKGVIDFEGTTKRVLPRDDRLADETLTMFNNSDDDRTVAKLVFEAMEKDRPVLVFCNTRKRSADICSTLTQAHCAVYPSQEGDDTGDVQTQRDNIIGHLQQESKGMVDKVLLLGIKVGIGMHTGALHPIERQAVEDAFRKKIIKVLCCTSTLAAGVNLPVSRIIIRSPWIADQFISCSRYLQQIGRAGRDDLGEGPDSYILLRPQDVSPFEELLQQHVENVTSQLLHQPTFYKRKIAMQVVGNSERSVTLQSSSGSTYSGITRMVLSALEMGTQAALTVEELIRFYKLTLLYQQGEECKSTGNAAACGGKRIWTIRPLLSELQDLLKSGYVALIKPGDGTNPFDIVEIKMNVSTPLMDVPGTHSVPLAPAPVAPISRIKLTSQDEDCVLQALEQACDREPLQIMNYSMMLTTFTMAASAACMPLEDAERFDKEAEKMASSICLNDPLSFLYLSITTDLCKPLTDGGPYGVTDIVSVYHNHKDRKLFEQLGLSERIVSLWVLGSPKVRNDDDISSTLTRIWSASFMNELCESPDNFEVHCREYGFDRGTALELASLLSSRCGNLRKFCTVSERHWWFPPLASRIIARLTDAAKEDVKPLLVISHVTPERAKVLVKMGMLSVRDVAVSNPAEIADKVKFLGISRAVEMVNDARVQLTHEAMILGAESQDQREALRKSSVNLV